MANATPTITVRKVDSVTGEPLCGNGQTNFISDGDAVAQIIGQRLKLFQGEWWEDLADGLPMFQQILGGGGSQRSIELMTQIIAKRITDTIFVTSIASMVSTFQGRKFVFTALVETQFGTIQIGNAPASSAALTTS